MECLGVLQDAVWIGLTSRGGACTLCMLPVHYRDVCFFRQRVEDLHKWGRKVCREVREHFQDRRSLSKLRLFTSLLTHYPFLYLLKKKIVKLDATTQISNWLQRGIWWRNFLKVSCHLLFCCLSAWPSQNRTKATHEFCFVRCQNDNC